MNLYCLRTCPPSTGPTDIGANGMVDQLHILLINATTEELDLLTGRSNTVDEVECAVYMSVCIY